MKKTKKQKDRLDDIKAKIIDSSDDVNKVKKITKSDESNRYYKTIPKIIGTNGTTFEVFINVDKNNVVNEITPKGTRVLVAKYPDFYKLYLYKTHRVGDRYFPNGGVTIYNTVDEMMQCYHNESTAIHPEGGSYRFTEI
jgi:hypothetical protein